MTTTQENLSSLCIDALSAFVSQRSGIDFRNYGDRNSFMSDYRRILRDGRDAREFLRMARLFPVEFQPLFSGAGRLSLVESEGKIKADYTAGQYFPTEYRSAICRAMAELYWTRFREDGAKTREEIIAKAKSIFPRAIVKRWFR